MNNSLAIQHIQIHSLDVPRAAPFTTSSSALEALNNMALCIELADGSRGWGEVPILPPITVEDPAERASGTPRCSRMALEQGRGCGRRIAGELAERIPQLASVRAGIEMAVIDALTQHWDIPLFRFFGGYQDSVVTDITIPICPADAAEQLAERYRHAGFTTLKVKIGLDLGEDLTACLRSAGAIPMAD